MSKTTNPTDELIIGTNHAGVGTIVTKYMTKSTNNTFSNIEMEFSSFLKFMFFYRNYKNYMKIDKRSFLI